MLLIKINAYLRRHGMAPARFGRVVLGDPSFVFRLRSGRTPRATTIARVEAFLARDDAAGSDVRSRTPGSST